MAVQLITYDLMTPGKDYRTLHEKIKSLGTTYWHCLDSVWMIQTSMGSLQIATALEPFIDRNDKLCVVGVAQDWAQAGPLNPDCAEWMRKNVAR